MRRLRTVVTLAALAAGTAGAEQFGVQVGYSSVPGNFGVHLGGYGRLTGFGPVQAEWRTTLDTPLGGSGTTEVGADALVSVNLLLLRPYGGVGVAVPLDSSGPYVKTTVGARFSLLGPFSGFAEGNFGRGTAFRVGALLRF
ncbi:hypothetical protein V3W47_12930 [Deinococcus sp. YIM 134068]|uniref:hypothetical protein n=1 Tax=Deinococcus lichenicola TaxID=3118910 RepID=UPI002F939541